MFLPSCSEFYCVLVRFIGFYWVLLGFAWFYLIFTEFSVVGWPGTERRGGGRGSKTGTAAPFFFGSEILFWFGFV